MSHLSDSKASVRALLDSKGWTVHTISPDATVFEAISQMAEHGIGALVVLDEGKLIGIISERDYTRKVILKGRHSQQTAVREILAEVTALATLDDTVAACMVSLTESRERYLPVIDQGAVVGIVSLGDLIKWTVVEQKETISHLQSYIVGGYAS
ncbi:MAG: CBS domain-containing protein [Bryobacterales bacterium]|nr:CBS domain-containing protein [Bryobacterales bacterium]